MGAVCLPAEKLTPTTSRKHNTLIRYFDNAGCFKRELKEAGEEASPKIVYSEVFGRDIFSACERK